MRSAVLVGATMLAAIGLASVEVAAEYRGPHGGETKVAQILKKPKDDSVVLLRGVIAQKLGPKTYLFRDETGEIRVEIAAKRFPAEPIDDKTRVEISGEVEKEFRRPVHIDVDALRILPSASN